MQSLEGQKRICQIKNECQANYVVEYKNLEGEQSRIRNRKSWDMKYKDECFVMRDGCFRCEEVEDVAEEYILNKCKTAKLVNFCRRLECKAR